VHLGTYHFHLRTDKDVIETHHREAAGKGGTEVAFMGPAGGIVEVAAETAAQTGAREGIEITAKHHGFVALRMLQPFGGQQATDLLQAFPWGQTQMGIEYLPLFVVPFNGHP